MVDRVIIANFEGGDRAVKGAFSAIDAGCSGCDGDSRISLLLQVPVLSVDRIGMLPAINLASRPLTAIDVMLKRAEDLFLSCLILLLAAPSFCPHCTCH